MTEVPAFHTFMSPLLEVLRESPTPLSIEEADRRILARLTLPAEVLAIPHGERGTEVEYRIAWARTWLKKAGWLDNPSRGKWTVTAHGRNAGPIDPVALVTEVSRAYRASRSGEGAARSAAVTEADEPELEPEGELEEEESSTGRVGPVLSRRLMAAYEKLGTEGALPTREQVSAMLARFRERFGPEALAGLDGVALLTRLHARGNKDSLVHWLEFKEDAELTTSTFGSIAGGSALKFGLYQSVETGAWMTGSPQQQRRLETEEAVAQARQQRDQLLAAAKVLGRPNVLDLDDAALQRAVEEAAPDMAETAWGHKVLAMWFPELLDPFHVREVRSHHLRRLLKLPEPGRYQNLSIFGGIARQLGMTLLELGRTLVEVNGAPYTTWRLGTRVDDESLWDDMLAGGYGAIGWDALGSLDDIEPTKLGKEAIRERLQRSYPTKTASALSKQANQIYAFVRGAQERDLVVAMDGAKVLGVGRITGPYEHLAGSSAPHRRRITWESGGEPWPLPETEGLLTTFVQLHKHPLNLIEIEARLLGQSGVTRPKPSASQPPSVSAATLTPITPKPAPPPPPPPLEGIAARVENVLSRKRQVILYGPPGTGKTHWASAAAREIVARGWFQKQAAALDDREREELAKGLAIELISFHPAYGYEDFLEGYRPTSQGAFELRDGVMKRLCARAAADGRRRPYVLIIDEINRGDLPRIFGELLTVIERDKRGRPISLPLSGAAFAVPDNVLVIGTMNTADRSIALLDAALRRRFGFVELLPDTSLFRGIKIDKIPLEAWLDALNDKILAHAGRDARNLRVGHAYFMQGAAPIRELSRFAEILRDDVIPLLEEVCYEDFDALERILGGRIVQRAKKRIDAELFEPERYDALQDAILQAFPSIVTTKAAAEADIAPAAEPSEEDEDDEPLEEPAPGA